LKHNATEFKEIEWRNAAICLSLMEYNEKNLNKLIDMYDHWKERILDSEVVKDNFNKILDKLKKKLTHNKELKD
jgi:hypothetical protein